MSRKKYNTKKIRTFLLFLFLACIIWILTKFSREYTATVSGKIKYTSIPQNMVLRDDNVGRLSFDLTANGFEFLLYQIKTPEIELKVSDFYAEGNQTILVEKEALNRIVNSELDRAIAVRDITPSQLVILLEALSSRKYPVRPKAVLGFKEGYRKVGEVVLKPDSVTVSGAMNLLDTLTYISTEEVIAKDLEAPFNKRVNIKKPNGAKLSVEPSSVELSVEVQEFTQKSITVPIRLENVPPDISIRIIPETLSLTFDVSVSDFNDITAQDFLIVCDFSEKNSQENFMIAKIVKQPDVIANVESGDRKIDYLIFK